MIGTCVCSFIQKMFNDPACPDCEANSDKPDILALMGIARAGAKESLLGDLSC